VIPLRTLAVVLALLLFPGSGATSVAIIDPGPDRVTPSEPGERLAKRRKRRKAKGKRRGKGKRRRKRTKADEEADAAADSLFDATAPAGGAAPPPPPAPPPTSEAAAPVLDLTGAGDTEEARKELLLGTPDEPAAEDHARRGKRGKRGKKKGVEFDFGGDVEIDLGGEETLDFGGELADFEFEFEVESAERERFDEAMSMMSDEDFEEAATEFRTFLDDRKFAEFKQETEYQLAKALYKLGLMDPALKRFKVILDQGASHRRYRKSIEWLFFISRKMADETPVLSELAQFRNVTFPKAYRNEYQYLLAKYLFIQAERFEVERLERQQRARQKKSTDKFNFEGADGLMGDSVDFSDISGAGLDFSDFGGGEMDLGAGGGEMDFGAGGGEMDLGAGGGEMDFGAGGGEMDFGGSSFDFGAGGEAPEVDKLATGAGPVREAAPQTAQQAIAHGLEFVVQVEGESKFHPRAKYLEGLLAYLGGRDQEAVNAFQEVVRLLNPREGARLDPHLREMAFLSLARVHYGYKQFDRSAYYYDLIDRDSENWLTALFEAAWAYYRRGDFEKALGNLLTLHSPFFEREYFPESQLVKAIIYFEACRYGETREIVDTFYRRFKDVMKEIQRIAESRESPELLYDRIVTMQQVSAEEKAGDDVTQRLVSLALADPAIRTARSVVQQTQDQIELVKKLPAEFREARIGREVFDELQDLAAARAREAGEVTRKKFEGELYELKSLLAQALRIKIEVVSAEKQAIARKMRGEANQDAIIPAVARSVVGDEQLFWPYEGEYWRDELGTYELDFSMCRPLAAR
jgi:outer membrane protein assembly factor BamD (BamD/ComL family)